MRLPHEPQQFKQPHELAEAREARPSGAIRIPAGSAVPSAEEDTLRLSIRIARTNAPVPRGPSMVVDPSYMQAVSVVKARIRAHRLRMTLTAACAFVIGTWTWSVSEAWLQHLAASTDASHNSEPVGAALIAPATPVSMPPSSEAPRHVRMNQATATAHVHEARALIKLDREQDARHLLTLVLKDRPGFPPALAAMVQLELEHGDPNAAVHWARLTVSALPRHAPYWELLDRAYSAAGLKAEAQQARARAHELSEQSSR